MCQIIKQERNILLVLNELCLQVIESGPQSASHGDIDLLSIAQKLQESGMSVKQTQRCWELFRKRLRDVQKRESEFITASRRLMTSDFCLNQAAHFKQRVSIYDSMIDEADSGALGHLQVLSSKVKQMLQSFDSALRGEKESSFALSALQ